MKKPLVWLAMVWLIASQAAAQNNVGGGASAAITFCQIDGDRYGGFNKIGWQLGGFAWYDFTERFSVQPEIQFTNRGAREGSASYKLNFTYLDVPVFASYTLLSNGFQSVQLQAGPSIGYLLVAKQGFGSAKGEVREYFDAFDVEGIAGVQVNVSAFFAFTGRIGLSLADIREGNNQFLAGRATHRWLSFGFRVMAK